MTTFNDKLKRKLKGCNGFLVVQNTFKRLENKNQKNSMVT